MSLMVTCPTCQAMLRVPPGADTIRCPQCKTVLALQAPAAAPPPPPVAEPAKPAVPLPFARPPASPPPAIAKPPEQPVRTRKVRAKFVEEHEDVDAEELPDEPRRRPRRELSDDEKLERKLDRMAEVTRPARVGITLLAYGALASCIAPLGVAFFFVSTLFMQSADNPFIWAPILGVGSHWLLTLAGFGFCCFGPRSMRHMAIGGVIVMLVHAVAILGLVELTVKSISLANAGFGGMNEEPGLIGAVLFANLFNNLSGVTNIPLLVHFGLYNTIGGLAFAVLLFAGGLEFAKLSLVGVLANHYAVEGKSPELGHQSIRFVYRLFWVVIVGFVGEMVIIGVSHLGFGFIFLSLPSMMMMNGYFLWCAFAWVMQFQVLNEVIDVITPERFTDKRANLDMY
jgi:LSD1 subclass zinc finger protein